MPPRRYKSTGVEAEQGRRRREDNLIQIRKNKRQHTLLKKRNHPLPHAAAFPLFTTLEGNNIPELVQGIWSDDPAAQVEATTEFRKLLSTSIPQIDVVIEEGLVPRFVEFLRRHDLPNLQYEAAWTLSYVTCGKSEHTRVVIEHGAIPLLVKLLRSSPIDVREKAIWCLGNIAGDDWSSRDLVLHHDAFLPLVSLLNQYTTLPMFFLRTATWTLSTFCHGKPPPPFELVKLALPVLGQLIYLNEEDIVSNACWALSYLSDDPNEKIQAVIQAGVCPQLMQLLHSDASALVIEPALRTLGNIVNGDDAQTQLVIDKQLLPCLHQFLTQNHEKSIKKEACWTIANITARNEAQIQAVIEANIIPPLVDLIHNAEFDIKEEAAWAIYNAICGGSNEQIKFLTNQGCIKALCDLLTSPDPNIVNICLEGLERILKVGEADKERGLHDGVNVYAQMVDDCEGLEKIENMETHDNIDIYEQAVNILVRYFIDE